MRVVLGQVFTWCVSFLCNCVNQIAGVLEAPVAARREVTLGGEPVHERSGAFAAREGDGKFAALDARIREAEGVAVVEKLLDGSAVAPKASHRIGHGAALPVDGWIGRSRLINMKPRRPSA